jgi:3-oxoacyl-[acyl-carrier-protein] synthase II
MGVISPLGHDPDTFWDNLSRGVSGARRLPYQEAGAVRERNVMPVRDFDPQRYLDRKQARRMDRCSQFAVAAAQQAMRQARLDPAAEDPYGVAVIVGSAFAGIGTEEQEYAAFEDKGRVSPFAIPMYIPNMPAAQVGMQLGLKGPTMLVASACAASNDAIGQAANLIRLGRVQVALAGGAEAALTPFVLAGFESTGALTRRDCPPEQASRPFDRDRDGFVMGEGAAMFVLESESHARARGSPILGTMLGYGATADAYHLTAPQEDGEGLVRAICQALAEGGLAPEQVDYVNAHGTGTPANDRVETLALKRVLGPRTLQVPVSSTKSMIGHLCGAAGALEAAATLLCLHHQYVHPTVNLEHPDPECDLDYVPNVGRPHPMRVALSNSMGFGGHNASLALGIDAPGLTPPSSVRPPST